MLPLYAGLLVMAGSAVAALGLAIDSPDFTLRAYILVCLGVLASYVGAVMGRNPAVLGALIGAVVFPLLVLSNTGAPITRVFFPDETLGDHSLLLPTLAPQGKDELRAIRAMIMAELDADADDVDVEWGPLFL